ncbi:MAG TPA: hypothetical protein VEU06_07780 [Micropepsaceae bacterium]|nr:hypothetical protein [Micropepsaceae bacterium]
MRPLKSRRYLLSATAALALAAIAAPVAIAASASPTQYQGCDGYAEAAEYGDGMTATGESFWEKLGRQALVKARTPVERATPAKASNGIANCDAALDALPEKHWMRKVSLLRARALHRIEAHDAPGALADLDLADAAASASTETYYARSLGVGVDFVRAYALSLSGDKQKGEALALDALLRRPYNRETAGAALYALGSNPSATGLMTAMQASARLVPANVDVLFLRAFNTRNYTEAADLYSQISPVHEQGNLNISGGEAAERQWRDYEVAQVFWAARGCQYAYALAAMGKPAEARAAVENARAKLANDTQPPPPLEASKSKDRTAVALHKGLTDIHARAAIEGNKAIDLWAPIVELRILVADGKADEALKSVSSLPRNSATAELVDAIYAQFPETQRPAPPPIVGLPVVVGPPDDIPAKMAAVLPEAEDADKVPDFERQDTYWFTNNPNPRFDGYFVGKPNAEGVTTFSFRGNAATQAMVEELALLGAAGVARKSGQKGMIVVDRRDTTYRNVTTYYGNPIRNQAAGYGSELDIVFVDPAALPEKYKTAGWRIIDPEAVYSALAPIYLKPSAK